jgi:aminopeptidase N
MDTSSIIHRPSSVVRFTNQMECYTVYGKGPVFLRWLREELGDEIFFRALRAYYQRHRYGVATTQDVLQAFEEASGRSLGEMFREWVTTR